VFQGSGIGRQKVKTYFLPVGFPKNRGGTPTIFCKKGARGRGKPRPLRKKVSGFAGTFLLTITAQPELPKTQTAKK
jgi:hypothetical protein